MDTELKKRILYDMILGRQFEIRAAEEYTKGNIAGFLHLYPGEEAVATGIIHAAEPSDYLVTTYREHVHALVRGITPRAVMAELFGKKTGCSHGMGGSMHLFDAERRFMGGYAIVGETFPVAIGIAYGLKLRKQTQDVVIAFFGDGASNQGTFHESLNMARLWELPVLFVCENNQYQIGTDVHRHSAEPEIYKRACAYKMPAKQVDGMDVQAVWQAARDALAEIRSTGLPYLLECITYRYRGHSMSDAGAYRPRVELEAWKRKDPIDIAREELGFCYPSAEELAKVGPDVIDTYGNSLIQSRCITQTEIEAMQKQAEEVVEDAVQFARQSPEPTLDDAYAYLNCNRNAEVLI